MAVARDATGTGGTTTGAACTVSHTVGTTGTNETVVFAFVAISVSSNSSATTCSATYGGAAMTELDLTLLGSSTNRSAYGVYYKRNPASGAQDCVVTPAGASTKAGVRVSTVSYTGVGSIGAIQETAALSLSTTSLTNGYNIFGHINGVTMSSPSQSQRVLLGSSVSGVGDFLLVQDAAGTGSNITFSVSGTATTPSTFGVALAPALPKTASLTDTFATKDTSKWAWGSVADVASGQAVFQMNSSYSGRLSTTATYDLTASEVIIELVLLPNIGNGSTETYFQITSDAPWTNDNYVTFYLNNGLVEAYDRVAGTQFPVRQNVTYSSTDHRWLRLRESGGTIYWDTSANGTTWTNFTSKASTLVVTSVYVVFAAGYWGTEPAPGTAIIDNINSAAAPAAPAAEIYNYSTAVHRASTY